MYWPLTVARRLAPSALPPVPATPDGDEDVAAASSSSSSQPLESAVHLSPSPSQSHPTHFVLLTPSIIYMYTTRPAQVVASLRRTTTSLDEYGANRKCWWRPIRFTEASEIAEIVVETTNSYLIIYSIQASDPSQAYSYTAPGGSSKSKTAPVPTAKHLKASFAAGPGEAHGAWSAGVGELREEENSSKMPSEDGRALEIRLRLVLKVDAGLSCALATTSHLLVATLEPPAIQAIPWPDPRPTADDDTSPPDRQTRTTVLDSLPWYHMSGSTTSGTATPDLRPHIASMYYSRAMDLYVWISSDGRAYAATLQFDTLTCIWKGRCFYGSPPRASRRPSMKLKTVLDAVPEEGEADEVSPIGQAASPPGLPDLPEEQVVRTAAINAKMSLLAVGRVDGTVVIYAFRPEYKASFSHELSLKKALSSTASYLACGAVQRLQWTSDGLALAVGWEKGWSVWSAWGKLMCHSFSEDLSTNRSKKFSDLYMLGVRDAFWGPGGTELFLLATSTIPGSPVDRQLFSIPFAKSAVAGQHSPDNTRFAFIQLDDGLLVYRGSEQPDMSTINPESDNWHHIKIPRSYLASNWPIRYASISTDGELIAVAGRRGLAHFSATSGRWKLFADPAEGERFTVWGGLQWYKHVLIVACRSGDDSQLRLYSRDLELKDSNLLHMERLPAPVILTSLFEDSLLVYTSDNTFYHFLILVTEDGLSLQLCGSITFEGVVGEPERVRGMSWMIPRSQQQFGDPMDDLTVATIIFLVDGKLVLLRPRRSGPDVEEVAYDMQILGDRIEYYWTHLQGIGTLENSLWGYDGKGIKLWLDALTIEQAEPLYEDEEWDDKGELRDDDDDRPEYKTIDESLSIPLDFYPLCVALEKGIIIGVEPEVTLRRSLDFAIFRSGVTTTLFLHHLLRHYLDQGRLAQAVLCAASYQALVYFPHVLEVLLHAVLEDEAEVMGGGKTIDMARSPSNGSIIETESMSRSQSMSSDLSSETEAGDSSFGEDPRLPAMNSTSRNKKQRNIALRHRTAQSIQKRPLLPVVVDFLDHFDDSLSVVVNCARKTEVIHWSYLFSVVGPPDQLFRKCLQMGYLKVAASYLLVLHTLTPDLDQNISDTVLLLGLAKEAANWRLCRDLLKYMRKMDEDGSALRRVVDAAGLLLVDVEASTPQQASVSLPDTLDPHPAPTMRRSGSYGQRSLSGANRTLEVPIEEDETELDDSKAVPPPENGDPRPTETSVSASTAYDVPQVSINGHMLPSTSPTMSTAGLPDASRGVRFPSPPAMRRSSSGGVGMSLHKVGLRSTENLFGGSPGRQRSSSSNSSGSGGRAVNGYSNGKAGQRSDDLEVDDSSIAAEDVV